MFGSSQMTRVAVALFCTLWVTASWAQTPSACPANATALAEDAKLNCTCAAGASGGVYGSVRYTADSSICQAAVHAGKPPGPIDLIVGGACPAFPGSTANGVTTTNWSSFDKSFSFGATLLPCPAAAVAPPPSASASAAGGVANCPSFITQSGKNPPGTSLTCVCDKALDLQVGAAYGVDRYSNDSPICVAARHAGKLPEPGGTVTVYAAEGCGKFEGSTRNDVTTKSWGSSVPGTIAFATPLPPCAAPAAAPAAAKPAASAPATPAQPNAQLAEWQARGTRFAAALPDALPGWEASPRSADIDRDTPFAKGSINGSRWFSRGADPVHRNRIAVRIYNRPNGDTAFPIDEWKDETKRKLQDGSTFTMVKIAGRDALENKPASGEGGSFSFLLKNGLFVSVSWGAAVVTRADAEQYAKALNFAKIEALATK